MEFLYGQYIEGSLCSGLVMEGPCVRPSTVNYGTFPCSVAVHEDYCNSIFCFLVHNRQYIVDFVNLRTFGHSASFMWTWNEYGMWVL